MQSALLRSDACVKTHMLVTCPATCGVTMDLSADWTTLIILKKCWITRCPCAARRPHFLILHLDNVIGSPPPQAASKTHVLLQIEAAVYCSGSASAPLYLMWSLKNWCNLFLSPPCSTFHATHLRHFYEQTACLETTFYSLHRQIDLLFSVICR